MEYLKSIKEVIHTWLTTEKFLIIIKCWNFYFSIALKAKETLLLSLQSRLAYRLSYNYDILLLFLIFLLIKILRNILLLYNWLNMKKRLWEIAINISISVSWLYLSSLYLLLLLRLLDLSIEKFLKLFLNLFDYFDLMPCFYSHLLQWIPSDI